MRPTSRSSRGSLILLPRFVHSAFIVWPSQAKSLGPMSDVGLVPASLRERSSGFARSVHLSLLILPRRLTTAFPDCGVSVHFASTSEVFESEVYAASHASAPQSDSKSSVSKWGGRPVLLLVGIRLGIDAVTPVYYDGIKVGIPRIGRFETI